MSQLGLIKSNSSEKITTTLLIGQEQWREDNKALATFLEENGIESKSSRLLEKIHNYKSIVILDDSSSMNELVNPDISSTLTKWLDCKQTLKIISNAHEALNVTYDFYALNRGWKRNVASWNQIKPFLAPFPEGETNLIRTLNFVLDYETSTGGEKPLLIYILTDGYPTNETKCPDVAEFKEFLVSRPTLRPVHYSLFFASDAEEIEWLYWRLKETHKAIDFTETFLGQLSIMQRSYGSAHPPFTFGDFVLKILLGPIDEHYHHLDSRRSLSRCCLCCCVC